ncbi:MAG TPA: hypothetical protein ENK02_06590 [Planctomycetes bacterium]|nr:hypothetical protein [Planctomycetota bacterium]
MKQRAGFSKRLLISIFPLLLFFGPLFFAFSSLQGWYEKGKDAGLEKDIKQDSFSLPIDEKLGPCQGQPKGVSSSQSSKTKTPSADQKPLFVQLEDLPSDERVKVYLFEDGSLFKKGRYLSLFPGKVSDVDVGPENTPVTFFTCRGMGRGNPIKRKVLLPIHKTYRLVVRGSASLLMVNPAHEDWVGRKVEGGVAMGGTRSSPCPISSPLSWEKNHFPLVKILFRGTSLLHLSSPGYLKGEWTICLNRMLDPSEGAIVQQFWNPIFLKTYRIDGPFKKNLRILAGITALNVSHFSQKGNRQLLRLFPFSWELRGGEDLQVDFSTLHNPYTFLLDESRIPPKSVGKEEKILVSNDDGFVIGRPLPKDPKQSPCDWAITYKRGSIVQFKIPTPKCHIVWMTSDDPTLDVDVRRKTRFFWTKKGWK